MEYILKIFVNPLDVIYNKFGGMDIFMDNVTDFNIENSNINSNMDKIVINVM